MACESVVTVSEGGRSFPVGAELASLCARVAQLDDRASIAALLGDALPFDASDSWVWLVREEGVWRAGAGDAGALTSAQLDVPDGADMGEAGKGLGFRAWMTGAQTLRPGWLWVRGAMPDAVASCLAVALGAALLRWSAIRLQAVQDAVFRLAALAATETELPPFLAHIHHVISSLVDAENFYVALYDAASDCIRFPYFVDTQDPDMPDPEELFPVTPGDLTPTGWVIHHAAPLLIDRQELMARLSAGSLSGTGPFPEYWMGAPLLGSADEVIGVVAVQTYRPEHRYNDEERALFLVTSQHIALALERMLRRTMLESEVARRTDELTKLNVRLQEEVAERERGQKLQHALYRISDLASQPIDMADFYAQVHGIISELVYAKNCYIALYDAAEDVVSFPYYVDERVASSPPRKARRGMTEYVIRQRKAVLVDHAGAMKLLEQGEVYFVSIGGGEGATWWLGTPLMEGDKVIGVIVIQTYDPAVQFGENEVGLMNFVAGQLATALSKKRAADALLLAYQELEQRVRDRTQDLDEVNARLQYENLHDSLTGLANRTKFMAELGYRWQQLEQGREQFAVIFADLDRFKHINDTFGHLDGDTLLIEAARRLLLCMRSGDVLARLGGDEFALLLPGVADVEVAELVAKRIGEQFDQPVMLADRPVFTSCSLGIVLASREHHQSAQDMLRDADAAMYQAKARGRDGYVVYNHDLRAKLSEVLEQEVRFRNALKGRDEIVPFMQPIVDGTTGRIEAFEALMRWRSPDGGWTMPAELLALAENSRLISRLDYYMLDWICDWLSRTPDSWPPVHLNCSSVTLVQPSCAASILGALERFGVAPSRLHVEVTEGALLADAAQASLTMATLQAHGVSVVLDDFGTGYASLSYLQNYHFDAVKIDKSFVLTLGKESKSEAIVSSVMVLARALQLDVVAEGVESMEVLSRLNTLGTMKLQGYLFAKPIPVDSLDLPVLADRIRRIWLESQGQGDMMYI